MTRKIRIILFSSFVFLYLVVAPVMIFYSLGYRIDFESKRLVGTGGLYLKIWPQGANILIDNKINKKLSLFSDQILIQGLFNEEHTILVEKEGYSSWQKTLGIKRKEVTRVENITLIKEKIIFEKLKDNVKNLYISPNGDLILMLDSLEYSLSIIDSKTKTEKNSLSLPENTEGNLSVASWDENSKTIILKAENDYFSVDYNKSGIIEPKTTLFENNEELTVFSPDKSKLLFFNDHEISFAETKNPTEKIFLYRFSEKINDCFWLNNNYLIFNIGNQIKISEIDTRDKINTVELPQQIFLTDNTFFELKNPKIFWDETNKKLYILDQSILFVSEPITDKSNN